MIEKEDIKKLSSRPTLCNNQTKLTWKKLTTFHTFTSVQEVLQGRYTKITHIEVIAMFSVVCANFEHPKRARNQSNLHKLQNTYSTF